MRIFALTTLGLVIVGGLVAIGFALFVSHLSDTLIET